MDKLSDGESIQQLLNEMRDILVRHGYRQEAEHIGAIILLDMNSPEFLVKANSNEIWGGAGSIGDQAFVTSSSQPYAIWDRDRKRFFLLMSRFGEFLLTRPSLNRRVSAQVEFFKKLSKR